MRSFAFLLLAVLSEAAPLDLCGIVGGGSGYETMVKKETLQSYVTVSTLGELKEALERGDKFIHVPKDTIIDLPHTKEDVVTVPEGVTIFSDRGIDGSKGGLLRTGAISGNDAVASIKLKSNTRLTGLRIEGPSGNTEIDNKMIGIQTEVDALNVEVDNNEIYNWPWSGVNIKKSRNNKVHHNYIHHNIRKTLGYGVVVQNGESSVEVYCNVFDANRHAIAGSGEDGDSYVAHDNLILNGGGSGAYHQFDMHQGKFNQKGGKFVHVMNNVFDFGREGTKNRQSVLIRGVPADGPIVCEGNIFTQDFDVGSKVAVDGVEGSVPSTDAIKEKNSFKVSVTYAKTNDECSLSFNSLIFKVNCDAVASNV